MKRFTLLLIALFLFPALVQAQSSDYPGRRAYPNVKVYGTEQLNQSYNDVIIVDVRSRYEFDTLHANGAINVPLNSRQFAKQIKALQSGNKPIVFYCNGHTCYKSYKACIKAKKAGIDNIFSYDSGIFDWAKAHPEKASMLGHSPVDPKLLISKSKLKKHMLEPDQFQAKINNDTVILDIREPAQRGLLDLFPYRQENISLVEKNKLVKFLTKILAAGSPLLIYDEAGKQVRWLQYYLEAKGITNYYFMSGGVKNFFKQTSG